MKRHFVYYLHDASGAVIYVGRSGSPARRISTHVYQATSGILPTHRAKAEWIFQSRSVSMSGPYDWPEAVAEERREIQRLNPVGNIVHTRRDTWIKANHSAASV